MVILQQKPQNLKSVGSGIKVRCMLLIVPICTERTTRDNSSKRIWMLSHYTQICQHISHCTLLHDFSLSVFLGGEMGRAREGRDLPHFVTKHVNALLVQLAALLCHGAIFVL